MGFGWLVHGFLSGKKPPVEVFLAMPTLGPLGPRMRWTVAQRYSARNTKGCEKGARRDIRLARARFADEQV